MRVRQSVFIEGLVVGGLGAASVALWFMFVDIAAGEPFQTPIALGRALSAAVGGPVPGEMAALLAYSAFHYASFAAVGMLASWSTRLAERTPVFLALFAVFFVVFQIGFYGVTAILDATQILGVMAWYQIALGNLLATAVMGSFLWRMHPAIRTNLEVALSS